MIDLLVNQWAAVILVGIAAWKSTEIVQVFGGSSSPWPVQLLVGFIYFGPFVAAEVTYSRLRDLLLKATRTILVLILMSAIVIQALNSSRSLVNERLELERLGEITLQVDNFERKELQRLVAVNEGLLRDSHCRGPEVRRQGNLSACQAHWKQRDEVLNFPRLYRDTPHESTAIRAELAKRLNELSRLEQSVSTCRRQLRPETFRPDLAPDQHGLTETLRWLTSNIGNVDSEPMIAHVLRGMVLLVLTAVVSCFHGRQEGQGPVTASPLKET